MKDNNMPISMKVAMAMLLGDKQAVGETISEALQNISQQLVDVVNSYDCSDLPFVVAAMLVYGNAMKSTMGEDGCGIVDHIMTNTACIAINKEEIRRQMKKDGCEEE